MVPGMIFTIEPMINMGTPEIYVDDSNGWTIYTEDGKPSAQWETMVLVTEDGCEILAPLSPGRPAEAGAKYQGADCLTAACPLMPLQMLESVCLDALRHLRFQRFCQLLILARTLSTAASSESFTALALSPRRTAPRSLPSNSWGWQQDGRNAEQVRVREHDARAHISVVVEHLHASLLQRLIQAVRLGAHLGVVPSHAAQMHLPGRNADGPDGP